MEFRNRTDLEEVKKIAHLFNEFDVEFRDYGIVNHPFIDSPVYPIKNKDGSLKFLDMSKYEDFIIAKKEMSKRIDKVKSYPLFQFMLNKRYASAFFKYTYEYLDKWDFKDALLYLFTVQEYPNMDKNFTPRQYVRLFKRLPITEWSTEEDLEHYNNLPEIVTIYRGVKPKNRINALSWTDNYDTARWFADRFEKNGKVYKAQINKKDILVYTNQRSEHECIIDFTKLMNIQEVD